MYSAGLELEVCGLGPSGLRLGLESYGLGLADSEPAEDSDSDLYSDLVELTTSLQKCSENIYYNLALIHRKKDFDDVRYTDRVDAEIAEI